MKLTCGWTGQFVHLNTTVLLLLLAIQRQLDAHSWPKWRCASQVLEEGIWLTLLAFDGRNRERENLTCPYCSFDLYAMKTCSMNDEISRSFFISWPSGLYWEWILATVDNLGGGFLCVSKIWKNWSAPPKHTGVFDVFYQSQCMKFLKSANEGSH